MRSSLRTIAGILILVFSVLSVAEADVRLPKIFSDHMILQKSDKTALWGWAEPNEDVTVKLGSQSVKTTADASGKWKVALDLSKSAPGPFQLTVSGKNQLTVADVLVGQVWLASGQSNMDFALSGAFGAADEIAHSANPSIRQFFDAGGEYLSPQEDCNGSWQVADPTTTSGNFTAVGYFFAKKVQAELKSPIGLIHCSYGGTASEQWTSSEGLDPDPELKAAKDLSMQNRRAFVEGRKSYPDVFNHWLEQNGRQDKPTANPADFAGMDISTADWTKITSPGAITAPGFPTAGAVWLRLEITLSADDIANNPRFLFNYLAGFYDYDDLYWNGERIFQFLPKNRTEPIDYHQRSFEFTTKLLKVGKNVLAFRFFSPLQALHFEIDPNRPGVVNVAKPPYDGWLAKVEYALPPLEPAVMATVPPDPDIAFEASHPQKAWEPCELFNGFINPIIPYSIAGVIWYQGESNADRAYQYRTAFPLLITDWRTRWGLGDLPFYFCQLANFGGPPGQPGENNWAELRDAQLLTLKLPNTGMAVLIDIGNPDNLHPKDKKDAGERLALIALANTYHQDIPFSGPLYQSNTIENDKIRIAFRHTDGGLTAKPLKEVGKANYLNDPTKTPPVPTSPKSDLQGFAICGADHKWEWADARIDGNTVLVWSDKIPQPVAVRYAWDANPTCNLYNGADLPASPFRTDDFPVSTADARYGK